MIVRDARRLLMVSGVLAVAIALVAASSSAGDLGSWTTRAPTGAARQEVSYVQAGGKLYLAGGKSTLHQVYDPGSDTWSTVAPLPAALDHMQAVALAGKIYYIGGLTAYPGPSVGTVHIYTISTNAFSQGAPMPSGRDRGAGGIAVYDGKIYVAGGLHDGTTVAWFDVYDPATNSWSSLPDMPRPRDHFHAAVVGGRLYAIGGRVSSRSFRIGHNDAFDFPRGTWVSGLAPLPTLRGGFATAVFGSEIVVIGGEGGGATFDTVEAYNTATNTWRTLAPMPTARHGIHAAMWNGSAYIAAGGTKQGGGAPTDAHEALTVGAVRRPDGLIKLSGDASFLGNDVYNATGAWQTRSVRAGRGQSRSFVVRVQNDGSATDGFTVHGCSSAPGFGVRYLRGTTGTTDITASVVDGTYTMSSVAPGGSRAMRLIVTVGSGTESGATHRCLVTATSTVSPAASDAVQSKVTVP